MHFGIVRESMSDERRVALTPEGARLLIGQRHDVVIQAGVGEAAGFSDTEYLAAGAEIAWTARDVAAQCEALIKIHAPGPDELEQLAPGGALIGFLHLSNCDDAVFQAMRDREITAISLELIREPDGSHPVIEAVSAIGGRLAVAMVVYHLTAPGGGPGLLLGGCAGVPPGHVVVLGAGAAGVAAAEAAARLGARVTLLDVDPRRLHRLALAPGISTAIASRYNVSRFVERADVVIGAVGRRGEPAPKVLSRHQIRTMRPHGLFVDLSIDEGGCAETSRPSTPSEPVYVEAGIRHLCVPNLLSQVARTSSMALGNMMLPYLQPLGQLGVEAALAEVPALQNGCALYRGKVVSRPLSRFRGGDYTPLTELLR